MAANPNTPLPIPTDAQAKVVQYLKLAVDITNSSFNIRNQLLMRDRAYYREEDQSKEQYRSTAANNSGDPSKIQNVTVPVVMPQVESALAYLSDTFLSGYPIFGVVAPPAEQDSMAAMEAVIGENSIRSGWPQQLMQAMRDGLKYDLGAVEVVWEKKKTFNIGTPDVKSLGVGKVAPTWYEGNTIKRLSPYNTIFDTRVSPEKNHLEGEFAGYTELLSRTETKKRMDDLDVLSTMNFRAAYESATPSMDGANNVGGDFYTPEVNPNALLPASNRTDFSWTAWVGLDSQQTGNNPIAYKDSYEWTVLYCRIIPKEFGINVSDKSSVQIWKFIIINRSVVVFAQRQTNAHNYLPIIACKPSNDGMGWQSKSFAENVIPIQRISSALTNSALESQRRKVYDRMFYDPTKVRKQDIENTSPVARIPVKSAQFGKGIADAIYQVPYRDDGVAEIMQMSQQITSMGDIINGQNRVQQGQFQKGNKTRTEFETVMGNSNSRQKMAAIALEYTFYVPIKEIIKSNILQYQPPVSLMNSSNGQTVEVDPTKLRTALISFKMTDGLLPSDKLIDPATLQLLLQAAPAMPQIAVEYDLMGILGYQLSINGAHWIKDFKRTPEQQQQTLQTIRAASQASTAVDQPPAPPTGAP